jgi:hypothetical protein
MRYQERIYIQNDNRAVRNKDILNVNMSSDFCIFKTPLFDVSGATKVQCGTITCDLNDDTFNGLLTAATLNCITATTTFTTTLLSVNWQSKIYEDGNLSYSGDFYSTTLSGDLPSNSSYIASIKTGLDTLGYTYIEDGTNITIYKPYIGAKNIQFDACISFNTNQYTCPVGYSATPANDLCQQINVSAATFHGIGGAISAATPANVYGSYGTYFYPSIQNEGALPVYYNGFYGALKNQSGATITELNVNNTNTFWANPFSNTSDGRLNKIGLSASSTEYVGFSKCININEAGTYYVGIAADNYCRVKINSKLYIFFSGGGVDLNFKTWSIFPFYFDVCHNYCIMHQNLVVLLLWQLYVDAVSLCLMQVFL